MTAESPRRRRLIAAGLWLLFAFLTWNVRFDYGVRLAAKQYVAQRGAYLSARGPRVEMAGMMRAGIASSAAAATQLAVPIVLISLALVASARVAGSR